MADVGFFVLNIISVCAVSLLFLHSFAQDRRKLRELEVSYLNQEMMLRHADKLATLGTLAAGVAHELNNPAAAAARGVGQLRPLIERLQSARLELCTAASPQLAASIQRAVSWSGAGRGGAWRCHRWSVATGRRRWARGCTGWGWTTLRMRPRRWPTSATPAPSWWSSPPPPVGEHPGVPVMDSGGR